MGMYRNADHSTVIERIEGVLPSGEWEGKPFTLDHLGAYQDSRYGVEYIRFQIEGGPSRCYQYSGKNIKNAKKQMDEMRRALADADRRERGEGT